MKQANSYKIDLPQPNWNSEIVSIILELEKMRNFRLRGSTPPYIFLQINRLFQFLETLASARIEGNKTTLDEAIDNHLDGQQTDHSKKGESWTEITNIDKAIDFIKDTFTKDPEPSTMKINDAYIFELHKLVTSELSAPSQQGEGSQYIGQLRKSDVKISKSRHKPPNHMILKDHFDELIRFINQPIDNQNHLLMIATAHHRFMYIHPFDNGNGRVGRLLNYALLMKLGYENTTTINIFNPSALFFANRQKYYDTLMDADSLEDTDILHWCSYFLKGLRNNLRSVHKFLDRNYIAEFLQKILAHALHNAIINKEEHEVLSFMIQHKKDISIKANELGLFGYGTSSEKTYFIRKLRDKKILTPETENGRVYIINLYTSPLLRSAIHCLRNEGFIHETLDY